jgi:hypothetical protein
MCCIQVVPLLGYEQTKTSDGRRGRDLHFWIVAQEVMGSRGMGGNDVHMIVHWLLAMAVLLYLYYYIWYLASTHTHTTVAEFAG